MWTEEPNVDGLRLAQEVALVLAGTVPIPSPVPAVAVVLVGKTPAEAPALTLSPESEYYIRIVQFPGPGAIVSYYLAAGRARLVKGLFVVKAEAKEHPDGPEKPRFLLGKDLATALETLVKDITEDGPKGEQLLATEAVVYVPEGARVQVRTDRVTTAGEIEMVKLKCECCCPGKSDPW